MNSEGTTGGWTVAPLLPWRGVVYIACQAGFIRRAICANISLLISAKAASPFLHVLRSGPVLVCTSTTDPNDSVNLWGRGLGGHQIREEHWFGESSQLVALIKSAPVGTAAVFVDSEAAPPEWLTKAVEILEVVAQIVDFPIVVLGNAVGQALNPIDQVPRQFRRCRLLLTLRRIEQDDEGGMLPDAYLLLVAQTAIWSEWTGVSLSLCGVSASDGHTVPCFVWRELLKGSPYRLAREASAGSVSPAIRVALAQAVSLLALPMTSTRLWEELLTRGHAESVIEKALTRGEKRGMLAKNALRNTDGTFMCWQWRRVVPPWPFPTSGTQSTPPSAPSGTGGGVVGMVEMRGTTGLAGVATAAAAVQSVSVTNPASQKDELRFSDGSLFTYDDADECDQRYSRTNPYDRSLLGLELNRMLARDYLRESRKIEPTEGDVELLASAFPLPPEG